MKDESGYVTGVRAGEDEVTAHVVIVAEGQNSLLTERSLGAPRPAPNQMAVGIKEVFELTEQNSTSDEELARLKGMCKAGSHTVIAIDDYGTGHSNIVNVLRYAPQLIKIDRELISGIQNDSNKQLFVRNTIDFAHQNGIRALAEGVETEDQLAAMIKLGIAHIKGFYFSKHIPETAFIEFLRKNNVSGDKSA